MYMSVLIALSFGALVSDRASCAPGLGDQFLWTYSTEDSTKSPVPNRVFKEKEPSDILNENEMAKIIGNIRINVVSPGKHLRELMNKISTVTRGKFLSDYEHYFKELDNGSTSRPMLYAYLGLKSINEHELSALYEQYASQRDRVIESCESLAIKRDSSCNLDSSDRQLLDQGKERSNNKLSTANLVLKNNMNLFMMDTYLLLCSKVEPKLMNNRFPDLVLYLE